ncbi:glycoside hydrolase domain-containing protein [Flagellimonas pacifica]|uniref:Por secretion system C-terminal sorting domain-containing protein n=1 Tax=Flagellimonas pacifica TaxID=1247520 RepID=A0A285MQP6_9FLAO|nr:glycoside hydrolase domain-containing protein [Allomuricauda parva]SNY99504.1 Por secretion system C-terminal sorting domain-containing protein [Allomuricauda parva]
MKNRKIILNIVASWLTMLIAQGAVLGQELQGSFTSKFKRYQKNESFLGTPTQNLNTVAWKGDRLQSQVILWSDSNIDGLSYVISDLSNGTDIISNSNVHLRFGQYIKGDPEARSCGEYPSRPATIEIIDALGTQQIVDLPASDPIKLWITIDVPATTPIGSYSGTFTVNGGAEPLVFDVTLEVVDYTLPDRPDWDFHLDLWQFPVNILDKYNAENPGAPIAIWSDEHFALFEPAYRLLADAGQKAIAAHIKEGGLGAPSMIRWIKKIDGTWEYDFTAFEKYVEALMSWGISGQIDCFSPVGWFEDIIPHWDEATNSMVDLDAPLGSAVYNERWDDFLTAFKIFLDSKGWFDITVLYLDEVEQNKLDAVFSMVNGNDNTWKIGIAHTSALSSTNSDKLYDASGILGTSSSNGRTGKITTFYTSCTQTHPNSYVTPENSLAEMVWMGWHASKENLNGYLRWAFDNWRLTDPFDARDGAHTAGDFAMVYRTSNSTPIDYLPSLRLIMLREGIQDYQKLKIVRTQLESSSDPYDQEILAALNLRVDKFGATSGGIAETLVIDAQNSISALALGEFSYCRVAGDAEDYYYVEKVTSSGGTEDIDFSTTQFPVSGYEHHFNTKLSLFPGQDFSLQIQNSAASNCARTTVWIDWNGDEDFEDAGELVFMGGAQNSCDNNISYDISSSVPSGIDLGTKRVRVQVRESSEEAPQPCGDTTKSGTVDFDLEVVLQDPYCEAKGDDFLEYYVDGLTTEGGITSNIDFSSGGFPFEGYEYHTESKIDVETGGSFTLNLENASTSGCARTRIWIDWNNDNDFEDDGENVYNNDIFQSCENTTSKSVSVQVPSDAILGTTRMRIRLRDAWLDEPAPCGVLSFSGTTDFDIEIKKKPFNLANDNFTIKTTGETCQDKDNGKIEITSAESFDFKVSIDGTEYEFSTSLSVENLKPETYQFCITSDEEPTFEQCFEAIIADAATLSAKAVVSQFQGKTIASLQIESGSAPFTIKKNDEIVGITLANTFEVEVQHGDILSLETDKQCEGSILRTINVLAKVIAFPNPTFDMVQIVVPQHGKKTVGIDVINLNGQHVLSKELELVRNVANLSVSALPSGVYFLRLENQMETPIKIVKQ